MKQTRRKWSVEQKLQMIQESVTEGVTPVIRKHNVSQSLFHKWKKQFDLNGLAGLNDNYKRIDPEKTKPRNRNQTTATTGWEIEFGTGIQE